MGKYETLKKEFFFKSLIFEKPVKLKMKLMRPISTMC